MNITECREELEQCYRGSHSRVTEARLPDISPTFTTQEFHDLGEGAEVLHASVFLSVQCG